MDPILLRVKRQDRPDSASYWEEFRIPYRPGHNVHSLLMEVQLHPVRADGTATSPVVWDASCLEEVCGSCTMFVNGQIRQACSALVDSLARPVVLEPMKKFPVVRDLAVDRSRMFENLKRVKAWVPIDGTYDLGPGPRMTEEAQQYAYALSRCMTCGCCLEACPQRVLDLFREPIALSPQFRCPVLIAPVTDVDAHFGQQTTYDYYRSVHGRDGIDSQHQHRPII